MPRVEEELSEDVKKLLRVVDPRCKICRLIASLPPEKRRLLGLILAKVTWKGFRGVAREIRAVFNVDVSPMSVYRHIKHTAPEILEEAKTEMGRKLRREMRREFGLVPKKPAYKELYLREKERREELEEEVEELKEVVERLEGENERLKGEVERLRARNERLERLLRELEDFIVAIPKRLKETLEEVLEEAGVSGTTADYVVVVTVGRIGSLVDRMLLRMKEMEEGE